MVYDYDAILALFTGAFLLIIIAFLVAGLVIYTLCMKWALNRVDGKETEFGTVFVTSFLSFLVGNVIPCGCFLSAYLISSRHELDYGKGLLAYILAMLLPIIFVVIVGLVLTFAFGGLGLLSDFM